MSEEAVVRHCSPTLAGIKTGSMFNYSYKSKDEMIVSLRRWNKILIKKGLRAIPLRFSGNNALIYIYRPSNLSKDFQHSTADRLLKERGYSTKAPDTCVIKLIKKLGTEKEFPHEIGLFLGYPPEDVDGFIENKAENFKFLGHWKVYGDEKRAKKLFDGYNKCTDTYIALLKKGEAIEELISS